MRRTILLIAAVATALAVGGWAQAPVTTAVLYSSNGANAAQPFDSGSGGSSHLQASEFSVMVTGVWTSHSGGVGVGHFTTSSTGLLLGYRLHLNHWEALEVEYGYTRNGQDYTVPTTGFATPAGAYGVHASMQELVANEVLTTPRIAGVFQPFVLVGAGGVFFRPISAPGVVATNQSKAAINYGFGVDFHVMHLGARLEYQILQFRVPNFNNPALTVNKWAATSQPALGLVFTF